MRYLSITVAIALALSLTCSVGVVRAAQTSPVEKAIEGVKDTLDNLVSAKDEKSPDELAFRIATLRKVIEFSITEAKDLKVKLIAAEVEEDAEPWKEATLDEFDAALAYYREEEEYLEDEEHTLNLAGVKAIAGDFKEWRTSHFLPIADTAQDFLLITQEGRAIKTAEKRAQKIGEDVQKLKNARQKIAKDLAMLLEEANGLIEEAADLNETARVRFWETYIIPLSATSTTDTASSTDAAETATSSEVFSVPLSPAGAVATSTEATSTVAAEPLPPSIRDLVKSSLAKVRGAYQVFIEMSTLVRKVFK